MQSADDGERPFVPLFVDFLLLPTVKHFWQDNAPLTDALWEASIDSIKEEIEDQKIELILHARNIVLQATLGPKAAEIAETVDDGEAVNDAFFARATSVVCCGFNKCPETVLERRRDRWFGRERVTVRGRIGSLVEVLQHQHERHNLRYERPTLKAATSDKLPKRVDLPLEVACGVASLLELHDLDETRAKMSHLDEGSEKSSGYRWRNSKIGRIRFQAYSTDDKSAWHKLVSLMHVF